MDKKLIVINDFDYIQGGATNVAIHSAQVFHENGWEVTLFTGCSKNVEYPFKVVSLNDKEISDGQSKLRNIYNKKALKNLKKLIKKDSEYIIHIHGWTKSLSSSIFKIGKLKNVKVFLTLHDYFTVCPNGGMFNYQKKCICNLKKIGLKCFFRNCDSRSFMVKMFRNIRHFVQTKIVRFYKYIDGLISISNFSEEKVKSYFKKNIPYHRVNNPIQIPQNTSRANPENSNEYIYVGRLDPEKGVEDICIAAKDLGISLNIIGSGVLFDDLKNKYCDVNNIKFLGWQSKEEVFFKLKNARALLFPSLWYEGAPLTIFEAMSFGIPCIISNTSAATDFVNNDNGYVYNTGNVEELKKCLIASYDNQDIKTKSQKFFDCKGFINSDIDYYNMLVDVYNK